MRDEREENLFTLLRELSIPFRHMIHDITFTAAEKQKLLPPRVAVQKTVTLRVAQDVLLVSGIGDFRIERQAIRAMASTLGITQKQAHNYTVNPHDLSPETVSGLPYGNVSPFTPPGYPYAGLRAIFFIEKAVPFSEVAITLSYTQSVLIPCERMADLIEAYAERIYPWLPVHRLKNAPPNVQPVPQTQQRISLVGGAYR